MLTLLTATGCRPEAWALCERWMAAQTYTGPVRWVIVDDGAEKQLVTFSREGWSLQIVWPDHVWQPGMNTQALNLLAGLDWVGPDDKVVIVEDDDHYAPDWLAHVDKQLDGFELVGEMRARYYNTAQMRGRQLQNEKHASLCATALQGAAIDQLRQLCLPDVTFIDMHLWRGTAIKKLFTGNRVVGIKGLPGRGGIGMGHKPDFRGTPDPSGELLRSWIGQDAEAYL